MKHTLQDLYRENGFTVTPCLNDLIVTYGNSVVTPHTDKPNDDLNSKSGNAWWEFVDSKQIEFCLREHIILGSSSGYYEDISAFMGSPVAPVGNTHRRNIELLLTEDGRLIGVNDNLVMFWGEEGCDWRSSLAAYLAGSKGVVLGNASRD